jgi:hypothetical protein
MKEAERSIFEEQYRVVAVESARRTISVDGYGAWLEVAAN